MRKKEVISAVRKVLSEYNFNLTIRQIYYRLVSDPYNLFPNTRSSYTYFDKLMVKAREEEEIDEDRIEDRTRKIIGGEGDIFDKTPEEHLKGVLEYLKEADLYYSLKMWTNQEFNLEIWIEKDALAGLVSREANPYHIITFPCRGFSSYTKIKEGILRLNRDSKKAIILYFGDHDPSGIQMVEDLKNRFLRYGGDVEIKKIALTIEQVRELNLTSNPVKIADSRAGSYIEEFGEECWELDAIPPSRLQHLIWKSISEYVDQDAWDLKIREIKQGRGIIAKKIKEIMKNIEK